MSDIERDVHDPLSDSPDGSEPTTSTPTPTKKRGGGPKTPEGKRALRRNALKDGTRASVVLPEDMEAARAKREVGFRDHFTPRDDYEAWLVDRLAFTSVQIDRCAEYGIDDIRRQIHRAVTCWDVDQRDQAEHLAARIAKDPSRTARGLLRSKHGAEWLMEALDRPGRGAADRWLLGRASADPGVRPARGGAGTPRGRLHGPGSHQRGGSRNPGPQPDRSPPRRQGSRSRRDRLARAGVGVAGHAPDRGRHHPSIAQDRDGVESRVANDPRGAG